MPLRARTREHRAREVERTHDISSDDFDHDGLFDRTLMGRVYAGEPQAVGDALRVMVNFTFFRVPAMHRLDDTDAIPEAAAQLIYSAHPSKIERFDGLDWRGLVAHGE